ncbi:beta-1,6-N-acetylglucosaminyltransferase [uncultured Cytophaga sp.]|uniref:beta-1,6-N-acetylglucosaminyltransferase n=1 Tax=uncultured Cytophaga sp. TaxID=160238 RepID=UPI00261A2520|nr:beta-1,6-N-acetylglucosaminyltransferase [uncultured Cytophaga sp.]
MSMKIGFSILSHKTPDIQFEALLNQLSTYPNYEIAIHHDFNQSDFNSKVIVNKNVYLIENYVQTKWSHVNNIRALMKTFTHLYQQNCEWFITLSANCYPIKSTKQITDFLEASQFDAYIECNNIHSDHFDFYKYFRQAFNTAYLFSIPFFRKNGTFYCKPIRKKRDPNKIVFNDNLIPYHGSDWFIINRKTMAYILSNKELIDTIVSFLDDVNKGADLNVCPPEVVFQTLIGNNETLKVNKNTYRYIDWTDSINWHPNILVLKDFDAIQQSEALFARKFDATLSMDLIHKINKSILDK